MKITFPALLFLVFLVLKLIKVIAWSWWWVTAPLWLGFAVVLVMAATALGAFVTASAIKRWSRG
jgi:hypothetical protein